MSDEPAETFNAEAVRWIDGLSDPSGLRGSWRLQVLEHRVSLKETSTGEGANAVVSYERTMKPVRLTRFAKGCPWALVPEAERYLLSLAPYTGKIVNGVDIPGTYKPTRTRWIRDDQTNLDDQRRSTNENRHTLVQDLVESTEAGDGDSVESSADCVETVTTEYHWDEPSLPDTLPAGGQGVVVSLQQVARQEDGTYRYAIVTRTAKTRIGAATVVECTEFRQVTQQDCTNLYGNPSSGFRIDSGTGSAAQVPAQCGDARGTTVEWRNLRQNDDCTWNVSVVTTVAVKNVEAERSSTDTETERRLAVKTSAQAVKLADVTTHNAAAGTVTEHRGELRPDGLYDNTVSTRTEKTRTGQVVEVRRTVRGATVRTVNRHMTSAAADPTGIGTVTNTVTDSGRIDQEIVAVDRSAQPIDAGSACSTTVFEHVESDRTVQPAKPAKHYRDAGAGHRYEQTSRITEEGSYEVTVEDRQELQKANAQITVRKTLRGTQRTVVDRNVANPLAETGLAVGETRQSEVTPGGLYVTTRTVTTAEAAGTIGTECRKTVFEHVDSTTSNQAAQPPAEADEAGNGRTRRKSARQTEEGTWDVTVRTVEERSVTNAEVEKSMTLGGLTVRRRHRSLQSPPPDPVRIGESVSYRITDGGLYDVVSTAAGVSPAGSVSEECTQDNFSHRHSETRNETDVQDVETQFSAGRIVRKSGARTANGTASNTTEVVTAKAAKHRYQYEREDGSVVHVIQYRNQPSENVGYPGGAYALTVQDSVNSFGLHDGFATWMTNVPGRGASMADYKFMRSGPRIDVIQVKFDERNRWRRHRKMTVQLYHVRGSAYVDYLSDEEQANPGREDAGVLAVRLVSGPYMDSVGTVCAEWKRAELSGSGNWETCTASCKHGDESQDLATAILKILDIGGFRTGTLGRDANEGMKELAQALRELPVVLSASKAGATPAAGGQQ
jgi:hypothetical protein